MPVPITPGPWNVVKDPARIPNSKEVQTAKGLVVAEVFTDIPENKANACLIAAAPDLLVDLENGTVAAQAIIDTWESGDLADAVNDLRAWIKQAQETLDKLYAPPPLP